jgi:uncharacterized protein with HEPN domain
MRREELLLIDIVDSAASVAQFSSDVDRSAFLESDMVQSAVLMKLLVIGEASRRLPSEFTEAHASVPWPRIIGFKNLALHTYERIDFAEVWRIAAEDVPELRANVLQILHHEYPLAAKAIEEREQ